jgi:hypothetical protein
MFSVCGYVCVYSKPNIMFSVCGYVCVYSKPNIMPDLEVHDFVGAISMHAYAFMCTRSALIFKTIHASYIESHTSMQAVPVVTHHAASSV